MITLAWVYALAGAIFAAFAVLAARDRPANALFWALLALSMWAGDRLGDVGNGVLVLGLVAIGASGRMRRGGDETRSEARQALADRFGSRLFGIALIIPATALVGTFAFKAAPDWIDGKQATLIALALGVLVALAAGCLWLRATPALALRQGGRLIDSVGWATILPQLLAALGAVVAYGVGMALFTMIMGNAFAAFPVMTAAIGVPVLIRGFGGDPAIICAIGMLAGFCGTLMTPMAANFNLVPAALLNLSDKYGVIKRQVGAALPLLAINILLIYALAFR